MSDDLEWKHVTNYKFSYFTKKSLGAEGYYDPYTGDYDYTKPPYKYRPGYSPLKGGTMAGSTAMFHHYDYPLPTDSDFDITNHDGTFTGGSMGDLNAAAGLSFTCNNSNITDYGAVTDIPLLACWTFNNNETYGFTARSQMMWAPAYDSEASIAPMKPFQKFRKINTLVISGKPGVDDRAFLDADSDFTYTCARTCWGVGQRDSGWPVVVNLSNTDFFGKAYADGEHMGAAAGNPLEFEGADRSYLNVAHMPDEMSMSNFLTNYYQILHDGGYGGTLGMPGYAYEATNALYARVDFEYQADTNGIGVPAFAHAQNLLDHDWLPEYTDKFVAQLTIGPKLLNYKIATAECGRLKPYDQMILHEARDDSGGSRLRDDRHFSIQYQDAVAPSIGNGKNNVIHKTLYPLPYDGTETWTGFPGVKILATPDCTIDSDDAAIVTHLDGMDLDYVSPAGEGDIAALRDSHADAAESNIFRMFWGDLPTNSAGLTEAKNFQINHARLSYGTKGYSLIYCYLTLQSRIRVLQSVWTYDDTPREARIRIQKVKKLGPEEFTSIFSGDSNMGLDKGSIETNLGPSEQFDPRIREFGDRDEGEYIDSDGVYHGDRDPYGS